MHYVDLVVLRPPVVHHPDGVVALDLRRHLRPPHGLEAHDVAGVESINRVVVATLAAKVDQLVRDGAGALRSGGGHWYLLIEYVSLLLESGRSRHHNRVTQAGALAYVTRPAVRGFSLLCRSSIVI